jgi:hypothetical protein
MKKYLLLMILLKITSLSHAEKSTEFKYIDTSLAKFFIGNWSGSGEFANGEKISSDLSFVMSLDGSWIESSHADRLPNHYKAKSFWAIDLKTGQFYAYTFDNFHGHREFSTDGWKNNKLILTTQQYNMQYGMLFQHFIYEKLNDNSFKMTYETSHNAINWKLGDSLIFTRN